MSKKKRLFSPLFIANFIEMLPLVIIAGLAGFTAVTVVLLLLNQFRVELIWSLGPIAALICGWGVLRLVAPWQRPGKRRESVICDVLVLVGVVVWGCYHISLTSQHVLTDRDPATYAVTASWLSEHDNLDQTSMTTFSEVGGVHVNSAGFVVDKEDNTLYPQGQHALPALLGAVGKFVGPVKVLHFNVLFGMTALLAVYCFARIFMVSRWAILATAIMAFTLPLVYFSRDTYTEPLALTFTFGGLALIALAQKLRNVWLWVIAGLVFSSSLLARIDAYLALIGVAAFLMVYVMLAQKKDRKKRIWEIGAFALPTIGVGVLAWLDLKLLSPVYYISTESLITLELGALAAVLALGAIVAGIVTKFPQLLQRLNRATLPWRGGLAATVIVIAGVILATLPLWYEPMGQRLNIGIAEIQRSSGMEVEARKYTEWAGYWVSWYVGPIIAALGVAGLAYATYRSMYDKSLLMLCGLFVILGTSVVYFLQPSITPDQIWASRRMLPVIMPGVVIFGMYAFSRLADKVHFQSKYFKGLIVTAGSLALIVAPVVTSAPFTAERLTTQHTLVNDVCNNLPDNAVVVWVGLARLEMIQPTRTYCNVEAYGYHAGETDAPSRQALVSIAKAAKKQGKIPYLGIYRHQYGGLIGTVDQKAMTEVTKENYDILRRTLTTPPSQLEEKELILSLGRISSEGAIKKITSSR